MFFAAPIPDVQSLYARATAVVRGADHGQLAKAVLYEADGTPAGGSTTAASGITRWHFVFDNPTKGSPYPSATVDYGPSPRRFGRVTGHTSPYLEDNEIPAAPKLSLTAAVARLRTAGYQQPFTAVTLRDPLGPPFAGVRYLFTLSGGRTTYVAVSATNGKIIK